MSEHTPLSPEEIEAALQSLPGWSFGNDRLSRRFVFSTFREAISFIVRCGFEAEALQHHPEIVNVYNRVDLSLTTHDAGNRVTAADVELARHVEQFSWI